MGTNLSNHDFLFKIIFIGDNGVGKTCLITRYTDGTFDQNYVLVQSVDFKNKIININDKQVKLQIWDTCGHERFYSILKSYCRCSDGIFLVYDVTNAQSFENIKKWIDSIKQCAKKDVVITLIGNKCDLNNIKVIDTETGQKLADEYGIKFFETSVKNSVNIEKIFTCIAQDIFSNLVSSSQSQNTINYNNYNDSYTNSINTTISLNGNKNNNTTMNKNDNTNDNTNDTRKNSKYPCYPCYPLSRCGGC